MKDRLNEIADELQTMADEMPTRVEQFISEKCFRSPGHKTKFSDFYESFLRWLPKSEKLDWTKIRVSRNLPFGYETGHSTGNQKYIPNLTLTPAKPRSCRYKRNKFGQLRLK